MLASGLLREHEDHYALTGPLPPLAIPATLQDALMARLDQLAAAKAVAQLGATIGREFTYELLRAVAPMDELELWRSLVQLVQAEVLYQRGALPQATYLFKHALIQEAAYQSLLKSTRQHYHQRIAEILTSQFPATGETQPEVVAHHYTEAGLNAYALGYWQQAGDKAARRSAHVEAIAHFNKGLGLLKALPDTPERALQELTLQRMLGVSLLSYQRVCGARGRTCLCTRPRTVSAGRGHGTPRPGALRPVGILQGARRLADRTGGGRSNSSPWGNARTIRRSVCKATGPWEIPCSVLASSSLA